MRWWARVVLTLAVALMLLGPAFAQRRGARGGPPGGGPGRLLMNKSVQEELKMTDDQIKKVDTAVREVREKHQSEFQNFREMSQEERAALNKKVSEETMKALAGVLQPEQEKRFKQIELQTQGIRAFENPDVQKALNLTADQKDNIKTIQQDFQKEMAGLRPQGGGPGGGGGGGAANRQAFQESMKKMAAAQKEALNKAIALLTDDQKKTWQEMTGKPFEVRFEPPGGGKGKGG